MFAICNEKLYFKVNESTIEKFKAKKSKPFTYAPGKTLKSYYEVPADILESEELVEWAKEAISSDES